MVKQGQTVTFVDERGATFKATVIGVRTQTSPKKEILNLQYNNGGLKKIHSVYHESERLPQADDSKVLYWK